MELPKFKRLPKHIAIIPDGNRRWAQANGLEKQDGYENGIDPGFQLYDLCRNLGIEEVTYYGFTQDNNNRPKVQRQAFAKACVDAVKLISNYDADLLVVGDPTTNMFPEELKDYTKRTRFGNGNIKINFLVNYGWYWDLSQGYIKSDNKESMLDNIASSDISRIDLVIRWGNRRRLSGLLPTQSVYADFYVIPDMWPDFKPQHLFDALYWYEQQDITLGG